MAQQNEKLVIVEADVTAGPNELQLMTSLMRPSQGAVRGVNMRHATAVIFTIDWDDQKNPRILATIESLTREDNSGHNWIVTGYSVEGAFGNFKKFEGFYNSKKRTGRLKLVPQA